MPLSLMIIPLLLQRAMDQIYQVENKISLIVIRTIIGLILNIILNFLFIFYFKFGLFGVAFATSISNWLVLALSISALKQLNIEFLWFRHFKWFLWLSTCLLPLFILDYLSFFNNLNTYVSFVIFSFILLLIMTISSLVYRGEESELIKSGLINLKIIK